MLSLQFITHQTENYSYLESARMALEGGCKWIQLRMKEASPEEVEAVALQLKPLCKAKEAILILDDHVELAKKLEVERGAPGQKRHAHRRSPADCWVRHSSLAERPTP